MAGFAIKTFDELVASMTSWITAKSPQITDLVPGSVLRSICEACALCLEEIYVGTYLGFKRQLATIQEDIYNFERKAGTKATANVVFSRSGTTGTVTIPSGTRVETPSGLRFATTAAGSITAGNTSSNPVEVEALEIGTSYNVSASSITVMTDTVDGVETVTNAAAATGGLNEESDYAYKQRFRSYIEGVGRSNLSGLIFGALSVDGVTSASVVELFPPVANVNARLYIDDGSSGGVSSAKILEVQDVIDGDGTEENPGYRAAGVNVVVTKPTTVTQNVDVSITLIDDSSVDSDQVELDVNQAITNYINNLWVGEDIIHAELVAAVMSVYGVYDCTVSTPAGNTAISASQVGRVGTITLTFV